MARLLLASGCTIKEVRANRTQSPEVQAELERFRNYLRFLAEITTWLSLFFMGLDLISIHGERMFAPAEDSNFPRRRFGLPLFWSGHVQIAASLLILLGSQLLGWLVEPVRDKRLEIPDHVANRAGVFRILNWR